MVDTLRAAKQLSVAQIRARPKAVLRLDDGTCVPVYVIGQHRSGGVMIVRCDREDGRIVCVPDDRFVPPLLPEIL